MHLANRMGSISCHIMLPASYYSLRHMDISTKLHLFFRYALTLLAVKQSIDIKPSEITVYVLYTSTCTTVISRNKACTSLWPALKLIHSTVAHYSGTYYKPVAIQPNP